MCMETKGTAYNRRVTTETASKLDMLYRDELSPAMQVISASFYVFRHIYVYHKCMYSMIM